MACGTPVLANSVGSIPDIITEGKTGFLMEDNFPENIASHIKRALFHPDLAGIAAAGNQYVMENFNFSQAVDKYRKVIVKLKTR